MKRRIAIVLVILSLTLGLIPASVSASAPHPCDVWATRFWVAMAANRPVEANFAYGMWLGCTANAIMGRM